MKYGNSKTHFPCRKPSRAIRPSHFSQIRLCASRSLQGCHKVAPTAAAAETMTAAAAAAAAELTSFNFTDRPAPTIPKYSIYSIYIFQVFVPNSCKTHYGAVPPIHLSDDLPRALGSPTELSTSLHGAEFHRPAETSNFIHSLVFK